MTDRICHDLKIDNRKISKFRSGLQDGNSLSAMKLGRWIRYRIVFYKPYVQTVGLAEKALACYRNESEAKEVKHSQECTIFELT